MLALARPSLSLIKELLYPWGHNGVVFGTEDENMPLKVVSGMMKASGDEALLIMERDAGGDEIVLVTKEALLDIADPPLCNECRLQEYVSVFSPVTRTPSRWRAHRTRLQ